MSQETVKSKGSSKKMSSHSKTKDSQKSRKSSKKSEKRQKSYKGSSSGKNTVQSIANERDQLVNLVIDKIQIDFTINECGMIRQSIALYHGGESVEQLLNHILGLFTPKKYELLREIRKVIYADEVDKYDALVSGHLQMMIQKTRQKELEALENEGYEPEVEAKLPAAPSPQVAAVVTAPVPEVKAANEIVLQPVKSSYKTKDSTKVKHHKVKEPTPLSPAPDSVDSAIVMKPITVATPKPAPTPEPVETFEQPTIKPFVPFVPEPYVLYDKDKNPVQKLVHGVRLPANSVPVPVVIADTEIKRPSPTPAPVIAPAPAPVEVAPVKKVVKKVETTEVRTRGRKESIEVSRKGTKDNTVVSVRRTSVGADDKKTLLTIEKSSFDETSNTITIDATLNLEKPKINAETTAADSVDGNVIVKVPMSVEKSVVPPEPVIAASPAVVSVVREPVTVTVEKTPVVTTVVKEPVVTVEKSPIILPILKEPLITVEKSAVVESAPVPTPVVVPVVKDSSPSPIVVRKVEVSKTERKVIYHIEKRHKLIGLSISGGSDSRYQREIRIVNVAADSAASAAGLQVGMILLAIDDHSLANSTHAEACHLIRSTFRDKTNNIMVIKVE